MSQVNTRQISVQGGQLPVWVEDGEPTALVFLHYWGGSHRTFAPVIARLAGGNTVVSYDHRGWAAARELPGPYGIEQLAEDALDVVRELGLRRYVLVGHSMGGKTAQLAASRRPEGLAGLVLIAPAERGCPVRGGRRVARLRKPGNRQRRAPGRADQQAAAGRPA